MTQKRLIDYIKSTSPVLANKLSTGLTIQKAQESLQLSTISRNDGEALAVVYVSSLLNEMNAVVPSAINESNIMSVSQMILNEYWDMKIDEIILAIYRGVKGVYGKQFHAVSYQTICIWIEEVYKERIGMLASERANLKSLLHNEHEDRLCAEKDMRALMKPLTETEKKAAQQYFKSKKKLK